MEGRKPKFDSSALLLRAEKIIRRAVKDTLPDAEEVLSIDRSNRAHALRPQITALTDELTDWLLDYDLMKERQP